MSKEVIIIGGGIIGLCSAYYLNKSGHDVTVIDRGSISEGASFGNCGMIAPSHLTPIASPGMISKGMRWMLSQKSPFYIRPRLNMDLFKWGKQFYRSATQEHLDNSLNPIGNYLQLSKKLYREIASDAEDFFFKEDGLLMAYQTEKSEEAEVRDAEIAQKFGLDVNIISKDQLKEVEPNIDLNAIGAILYKGDSHLHPGKFMKFLKNHLEENGVQFHLNTEVNGIKHKAGKIESVKTHFGNLSADEFVLTAGAWSPVIVKDLGINLSMLPAKGYSFDISKSKNQPSLPTILSEGKVAITPMGDAVRFGGTLEITKLGDKGVRMKRIEGITNAIRSFYPSLNFVNPIENDIWSGYRPCSPDGLPYLGKSNQYQNLTISTGHAMLGLTLGPATGHIVNSLVNGEKTATDISLFHPDRKI